MSYSYWGIIGYGVCIEDIMQYIDTKKVNLKVREMCSNYTFEEDVFDDDTFYGEPYNNFAEFLCELDDTNSLTWEHGGDHEKSFLLYEPVYPWHMKENEPQSREEAEARIIDVLTKVTKPNILPSLLRTYIDYISDYGCG